jgi:hypothetical protein
MILYIAIGAGLGGVLLLIIIIVLCKYFARKPR